MVTAASLEAHNQNKQLHILTAGHTVNTFLLVIDLNNDDDDEEDDYCL